MNFNSLGFEGVVDTLDLMARTRAFGEGMQVGRRHFLGLIQLAAFG